MRNTGTNDGNGTGQIARFRLWLSRQEACDVLNVGDRALRKQVSAGKVERRKIGRQSRYRIRTIAEPTGTPEPETPEHRNHTGTGYRNTGTGTVAAMVPQSLPGTQPAPAIFLDLIQQLTADLASSEKQRGEAIGIGHMLADERDRAVHQLAELQRAVVALASSPRVWGLRRRLLAVLRNNVN